MNQTFSLLFYVKKAKQNAKGESPIYLRITIDGKATEISVKRTVKPAQWNAAAQKVNGHTESVKMMNQYLKTFEQQVHNAHHELMKDGSLVTSETLKNKLTGKNEKGRMLIPIFQDHNRRMEALVGKEYAKGTLTRYKTCLGHTQEFLKWKFNVSDIEITQIDHAFISDFEFFLRTEKACANNSAVKYIKNFGKIIRICMANKWLTYDPFLCYDSKFVEVQRQFLDEAELFALENKEFEIERIAQVRDIFLFSCYTGLAYIDTRNLKRENIGIGIDGTKWIFTNRQKTKTASNIPLLPQAEQIIEKYRKHLQCEITGRLLPVLSNQKMNSYLKEIADLCKIKKDLTFHIARHTFATTVTLSNGVSIESVSKMLGHKSIKTTQHYAKILDVKVSEDMKDLKVKLLNKEKLNHEKIRIQGS
ncbi:site-specific integrase [Chryseobacterium taklimakanense]|uniref:site-specific integrase n=1 Tax=Chryseobacterium taklimakanense TaxID=536441 RepID=UPI000F5E46A7|nr:site-specific integrase [Chryseobacterium taklimakanense]AZI22505.1 site-specific integrase [Chryseobacterium taklimakanense]